MTNTQPTEMRLNTMMTRLSLGWSPFTTTPSATPTPTLPDDDDDGVVLRYLDSFEGFDTKHSAPLRKEVGRLARMQGWSKNRTRKELNRCVADEFVFFFGSTVEKLAVWQQFCSDLGIFAATNSITQCKKSLRRVHVNIYDYIDCKRAGTNITPIFKSIDAFRIYTINGRKFFPKKAAKDNMLFKALLEEIL